MVIKKNFFTILLITLIIFLSFISLFLGVIDIDLSQILNRDFEKIEILLISRLPRLLAIICTGFGMSIAGLIMQQLCMNKFIAPSTGATISSAQLGILIAILIFPNSNLIDKTLISFFMAILGTWLFVFFIQKIKFKDIVMVPLIGIMFGNIIGGVIDYISYKYGLVQALSSWLVGDFSLIIRGHYEIVFLTIPLIIIAFIFANYFNIVGMGKDFSKNLGVNYSQVLFSGLSIASLITASIVVTVGTVPYLGLIIPNIISMIKGDKMKTNLIDTGLFGVIFVLVCDMVGRTINYPYEIPINLTVGIVGSVIFIIILFKKINPTKKIIKLNKLRKGI